MTPLRLEPEHVFCVLNRFILFDKMKKITFNYVLLSRGIIIPLGLVPTMDQDSAIVILPGHIHLRMFFYLLTFKKVTKAYIGA